MKALQSYIPFIPYSSFAAIRPNSKGVKNWIFSKQWNIYSHT